MMRNVFDALKTLKMTDSETKVAERILQQPTEFLELNGDAIAKQCHVSPSTIYRLCEKLGLNGLSELKVRISSSLGNYLKQKETFDYNYPIHPEDSEELIVHHMFEDYEQTILTVSNELLLDQLRGIIKAMKKAKKIDVYTSAGNVFFAENFRFQMQEIGISVNAPTESFYQAITAAAGDETHLAFIISFGGRGGTPAMLPKILKERKTPIVLLAGKDYADRCRYADYRLYLNGKESHYNKISSFSTRLSCLFLLDTIYAAYFETDYERFVQQKLESYAVITGQSRK